jgi:hypothetical protein
MFSQYHGFVHPNSSTKKTNKILNDNNNLSIYNISPTPESQSPSPLPPTSGLPIITIPEGQQMPIKLPSIKQGDYENVMQRALEPIPEIKYIQPEVIPKEKIENKPKPKPQSEGKPYMNMKPQSDKRPYVKPQSDKRPYVKPQSDKRPYVKPQSDKRPYVKPQSDKKPKPYVNMNMNSLDKYKINLDDKKQIKEIKETPPSVVFPIKPPEIISREKVVKPISKKKPISIKPKPISKKKPISIKQKPLSKKKPISIKPKPISKKKPISIKQKPLSKKKSVADDILTKIESSDTDYKKKFEKLKKVYLKQHDSLVDVFDGYQKLYQKVVEKDEVKLK